MDAVLKAVTPMSDYRLGLEFQNGSLAVINMERRVRTTRFARLASAEVFATAKADGDRVVWLEDGASFGFYCTELLDAMMMD